MPAWRHRPFAQLSAEALQLGSPAGGLLRVPSRSAHAQDQRQFIGEGQPIPVRRFDLSGTTLLPHKLGVISEFTKEITKQTPLDIQAIVKNEILSDTRGPLDAILLDNVAADAVRPHGLRYNPLTGAVISGLTPTVVTTFRKRLSLTFERWSPQSLPPAASASSSTRRNCRGSRWRCRLRARQTPSSLRHPRRWAP